jgi:hypothetical protein
MAALRQDLAYTFRRISKSPSLALTIMISIGLGIAANATIFSMVSRFVLKPPPVGDPQKLITLYTTHDGDRCCNEFPWPVYTDLRQGEIILRGRSLLRTPARLDWRVGGAGAGLGTVRDLELF